MEDYTGSLSSESAVVEEDDYACNVADLLSLDVIDGIMVSPECIPDSERDSERLPVCSPGFIPVVGMRFKSLEEGILFYREYAKLCGFSARLSSSRRRKTDGLLKKKLCVCNKQGLAGAEGEGAVKKKRALTRMGCGAKVVFKHEDSSGEWVLTDFHEGHNHGLSTPSTAYHLKEARNLTLVHKKMIMDNSRVNIGPTRTYRMFKEYVKGYKNVGASLVDFKNFMRDVKKFVKDFDAQMIIENFMRKKAMCSSFWFDFDVDDEGHLIRLFWADAVCRKNYFLFGDNVSLDGTYETNGYKMVFTPFTGVDHHRKAVCFGAGLIAKEDAESYEWLLTSFLTAMNNRQPRILITDQCPSLLVAIPRVFDMSKTKHRLCMWHIMEKVSQKVGPAMSEDTDFLNDFSKVVWNPDLEIEEFEAQWNDVIAEYELQDHKWFKDMYLIRKQWIPAFYRDLFLGSIIRTTSLSESENSFFKTFTNPHLTLVEFMMRFESAVDAQRWKQSHLTAKAKNSFPRLLTPLPCEQQASKEYTPTIFYLFQDEVKAACFSCGIKAILDNDDGSQDFCIMDYTLDKTIQVSFKNSEKKVTCSCKLFGRQGILCRHALWVLNNRGWKKIPSEYIVSRWTKDAILKPTFDFDGELLEDIQRMDETNKKIGQLWSEMFSCVAVADQDEACVEELLEGLRSLKLSILDKASSKTPKDNNKELQLLVGCEVPENITILPPRQSKNKGSGKRMRSNKEKASEQRKKAPRMCKACGELGYHDSRNCPKMKEKSETGSDSGLDNSSSS